MKSRSTACAAAVLVLLVLAAAPDAARAAGLSFGAAARYPTGRGPVAVAVGDFDGDGRQDLVTANASSGLSVLLGRSGGGFVARTDFTTGPDPGDVAVGDFNGDGKQDLVSAQRLEGLGQIGVLLGDGAGGFEVATDVRISRDVYSVALGDFDGDGRLDVASAKQNLLVILRGDGFGGLSKETDFAVGAQSADIAVGDFDGDGKKDLATADYAGNAVRVLLNGRRAVPIIRALSPARGHIGTIVTLTGWHFGAKRDTSRVWFGARAAAKYVHWSATKIRVKVPKAAVKGMIKVTVKTAGGRSASRSFKRL